MLSLSTTSIASETSQNNSPKQQLISSAERYQSTDNSTGEEDQQYGSRIEVRKNEVYELQGSEGPNKQLVSR